MQQMNRKQRRVAEAQRRKNPASAPRQLLVPKEFKPGIQWEQMLDPEDPSFILIEARIPASGMQNGSFEGEKAFMRIFEFCNSFMKAFTR